MEQTAFVANSETNACVDHIARNRNAVMPETNPTVVECCVHWSHGDGASPLRQADVPTPGRQLPQAKPGWWLRNGRASSSLHAAEGGLAPQKRVSRRRGPSTWWHGNRMDGRLPRSLTHCFATGDRQRYLLHHEQETLEQAWGLTREKFLSNREFPQHRGDL